MGKQIVTFIFLLSLAGNLIFTGCIKTIALKKVAGMLSGEGGTVFTGENDPQLLADALPFVLKTYETLLTSLPDDVNLLLATGKAYCMYAYAFIHAPADTISDIRIKEKTTQYLRAKNLYLRARDYLLKALEIRHPGFTAFTKKNAIDAALALTTPADSTLLYWTGMSWMGAFTSDKFDLQLALSMPQAVALLRHLLSQNESFGNGSVHDFFITYYGSMPKSMGGSEKKSRYHFSRSIELSGGKAVGPYVSLASTVCVAKQDIQEFKELLDKALAIDVNQDLANRLANTIAQKRAQWLLEHSENFFLGENENNDELDFYEESLEETEEKEL